LLHNAFICYLMFQRTTALTVGHLQGAGKFSLACAAYIMELYPNIHILNIDYNLWMKQYIRE